VNATTIAACVMAAVAVGGYLIERRRSRATLRKERRQEDEDIGAVINHRIEIALLNLSTERDRLATKVDELERERLRDAARAERQHAALRREVNGLRAEVAELQAALKAAAGGR
jgi:ABC-type phosphate transport system auxiliary subunit